MTTLITGGSGLVGRALECVSDEDNVLFLESKKDFKRSESKIGAIYLSSKDGDLRVKSECQRIFDKFQPTHVIHLAARVGGVNANSKYIGDFFYENIVINTNILECAKEFKVEKLVNLLSTCIYPDKIEYPIKAEQLHNGEPHSSNFGYAYAKRMLEVQSRAYNQQYKTNFICLVPNNIYGPFDNFHLEDSHVIPAIIRKVYIASQTGEKVILWGDGSSLREFTLSNDIAKTIWWALDNYNGPIINIGTTEEISIKDAANLICDCFGVDKNIIEWDTSKPVGQLRKTSDKEPFNTLNHGLVPVLFSEGIKYTVNWFLKNKQHIRGFSA